MKKSYVIFTFIIIIFLITANNLFAQDISKSSSTDITEPKDMLCKNLDGSLLKNK
ncbi:hypothetical protein [Aquimarina pacifica]|uniref:hypothetical protein n=1 Tax=Aquimarina pacifica TaxID=1296415 RepID=UPI0004B6D365|nr:hypothetical protein [Aquimarina pacifica]